MPGLSNTFFSSRWPSVVILTAPICRMRFLGGIGAGGFEVKEDDGFGELHRVVVFGAKVGKKS